MSTPLTDPRHWLDFVPGSLQASPLYAALWQRLQADEPLLALMDLVPKDQPLPITFFTAVNFLVLGEPAHPLAQYYPALHPEAAPPLADAYALFREFVLAHRPTLLSLLPTARLQTNEVTRCCNLLPAFFLAYQRGGMQPLTMLEIGSSAGFNLLWHHYQYHYHMHDGQDIVLGEDHVPHAPVRVSCEIMGEALPPLPLTRSTFPQVALCQGIELVPRAVHHDEDMRWVRAAIWPEEVERHRVLNDAIAFARQTPVLLHTGDASDLLPALLATLPTRQTAVIWHSFAVNQGPIQVKERLEQQLLAASRQRPLYRVSLEVSDSRGPQLHLLTYEQGACVRREHLAQCAFHGERMKWLASVAL